MVEDGEESNEDNGYESVEGADPTVTKRRMDEKQLLTQARTFRDFENLFIALDALERWKDQLEQVEGLVYLDYYDLLRLTINAYSDTRGRAWERNHRTS